jgi:ferrous iron transport protein B
MLAGADRVVAVVDATNLERHLYLVLELLVIGHPILVVLNLMDAAEAAGISIDVPTLERLLGVTVLPASARTGRGLDRVRAAMDETGLPALRG